MRTSGKQARWEREGQRSLGSNKPMSDRHNLLWLVRPTNQSRKQRGVAEAFHLRWRSYQIPHAYTKAAVRTAKLEVHLATFNPEFVLRSAMNSYSQEQTGILLLVKWYYCIMYTVVTVPGNGSPFLSDFSLQGTGLKGHDAQNFQEAARLLASGHSIGDVSATSVFGCFGCRSTVEVSTTYSSWDCLT